MSYSQILVDLAHAGDLDQALIHPMDQVLLGEILDSMPYKPVQATQVMFAIEQIQELLKQTYQYDHTTGLHLGRVGRLAAYLAKKANLPWFVRLECLFGGWIHDIGKVYIDPKILNKPDRLTKEEYEVIKQHVAIGAKMLIHYPHLEIYADPLLFHHEKYDGSGYPYGMQGREIPASGRITAIVDAYDAMTNSRPYTHKRTHKDAMSEIKKCIGTHFDPEFAPIFTRLSEQEIDLLS